MQRSGAWAIDGRIWARTPTKAEMRNTAAFSREFIKYRGFLLRHGRAICTVSMDNIHDSNRKPGADNRKIEKSCTRCIFF